MDSQQFALVVEHLGGLGTIFGPLPLRPKGMHNRTYLRLSLRYQHERLNAVMDIAAKLGMGLEGARVGLVPKNTPSRKPSNTILRPTRNPNHSCLSMLFDDKSR